MTFALWMKEATDHKDGISFLDEATSPFRRERELDAKMVIHGIGRGHQLLRNAEKWTRPEAGAGADVMRAARGQQWRLVMAYAGFEIFAKSMLGNFAVRGGPGVSDFLEALGDFSAGVISIPAGRRLPKGKSSDDMLDFLRTHKGDRLLLERWFGTAKARRGTVGWSRAEAIDLARIVRNLTAHGILSADLARKTNISRLSEALVSTLAETFRHALLHMSEPEQESI
jgi:hypothetical protein